MHYINRIDFPSIDAYVCAEKYLKRTCLGFDQVTPLMNTQFFMSNLCITRWLT